MRTTLTIDDDVAARLERERRKRHVSLKELVNDVLRAGLDALGRHRQRRGQFRTKGFNLGPTLVGSLDNIDEVLCRWRHSSKIRS
jgi:Ribbon-helix-helix protein, copG family